MKHSSAISPWLLVLLPLAFLVGCQQKVAVPNKFKHWNSGDGAFALDYPFGWLPQGGIDKNRGNSHVIFEKGGINIRVDASFQQSVMGDLLGGAFDTTGLPDDAQPEAQLHAKNYEYYKENYTNYNELPAETIDIPIGSTRVAEFTATEGLSTIHGIRATTVTADKGVTFRAYAPESQWEDFKPVFYKLLEGMKRGVRK